MKKYLRSAVLSFFFSALLRRRRGKGTLGQDFFGFQLGRETNVSVIRLNQNKNQTYTAGSLEKFPQPSVTQTIKKTFFKFKKVRAFFNEECRIVALVIQGEMEEKEFLAAWKSFTSQFSLEAQSGNVLKEYRKDPKTGERIFTGRSIRYVSRSQTTHVPEKRTVTTVPTYKERTPTHYYQSHFLSYSIPYPPPPPREIAKAETTETVSPAYSYTTTTYYIAITDDSLFSAAKKEAEEKLAQKFWDNL